MTRTLNFAALKRTVLQRLDLSGPVPRNRVVAMAVTALVLAVATAIMQWQIHADHLVRRAAEESLRAAGETSAAILSYTAADVETGLAARTDRLTGGFLEEYRTLMTTKVIPEAKKNNVTASATVVGTASVSATRERAVNLVFVDQTVTKPPPADPAAAQQPARSTFSARVTLEKVGNRWLVSGFEPV